MIWTTFLFTILAGYLFLSNCYLTKYKEQRLDAQRLIFESMLLGFMFLGISLVIRFVFYQINPALIIDVYNTVREFIPYGQPLLYTTLSSLVLSIIATLIFNLWLDKQKQKIKSIERCEDDIEKKLIFSMKGKKLLEFILEDGLVYIAIVSRVSPPNPTSDILMAPFFEGIKKDNATILVKQYNKNKFNEITDLTRENNQNAIEMVIPRKRIIAVSNFAEGYHVSKELLKKGKVTPPPSPPSQNP